MKLDDAAELLKVIDTAWPGTIVPGARRDLAKQIEAIQAFQDQSLEVAACIADEYREHGNHDEFGVIAAVIRAGKNKPEPDAQELARAQVRTMLLNSGDVAINRGEYPYGAELRNALAAYNAQLGVSDEAG